MVKRNRICTDTFTKLNSSLESNEIYLKIIDMLYFEKTILIAKHLDVSQKTYQ